MSKIMREARRNPLETSKQVFEKAGVPDVPKSTRCRIKRTIAKFGKTEIRPQLKDMHKKKRMECQILLLEPGFQVFLDGVNTKFGDNCNSICDSEWFY